MFVDGKNIYKFKENNKNFNFPNKFCLGSMSKNFDYVKAKEVSLKGNVHYFSVDYDAIDESVILNICKYLMAKNNIK